MPPVLITGALLKPSFGELQRAGPGEGLDQQPPHQRNDMHAAQHGTPAGEEDAQDHPQDEGQVQGEHDDGECQVHGELPDRTGGLEFLREYCRRGKSVHQR